MEADPNPFPKIDLFPRLSRVARFILNRHNTEPFPAMSEHHRPTAEQNIGQLTLFGSIEGMVHPDSIARGDDW